MFSYHVAKGGKTAWTIAVSSSTQGIAFGQEDGGHGLSELEGLGVNAQKAVPVTGIEVLAAELTEVAVGCHRPLSWDELQAPLRNLHICLPHVLEICSVPSTGPGTRRQW